MHIPSTKHRINTGFFPTIDSLDTPEKQANIISGKKRCEHRLPQYMTSMRFLRENKIKDLAEGKKRFRSYIVRAVKLLDNLDKPNARVCVPRIADALYDAICVRVVNFITRTFKIASSANH